MREIDVVPTPDDPCRFIADWANANGLEINKMGSLRTWPDSHHWHIRMPGSKGTLEATWRPDVDRFWFKATKSRSSAWVVEILDQFEAKHT